MIYYFSRSAFYTTRILVISCLFSGCSFFSSGNKAESLQLPAYNMAESMRENGTFPASWEIEQLDSSPYLYKIEINNDSQEHDPAYAVLLKECGIGKNASANATTRELLVGLRDLDIIREDKFTYGDSRVFFKYSSATLDDNKIKLATFSVREDDCVFDSVIWSDESRDGSVMDLFAKSDTNVLTKIYFAFSHHT